MGTVTGSHAEKEFSPLHKPEVVIIEGMAENFQHGNEVCHAQTRILRLPGEREAWKRNRLIYKE